MHRFILPLLVFIAPALSAQYLPGGSNLSVKSTERGMSFIFTAAEWEAIQAAVLEVEPRPLRVLMANKPCLDAGGTDETCPLVEADQPVGEADWAASTLARRFLQTIHQITEEAGAIQDRREREANATPPTAPHQKGFMKQEPAAEGS